MQAEELPEPPTPTRRTPVKTLCVGIDSHDGDGDSMGSARSRTSRTVSEISSLDGPNESAGRESRPGACLQGHRPHVLHAEIAFAAYVIPVASEVRNHWVPNSRSAPS